MRAGPVPDVRRAGRPQGRERIRPPAVLRRRSGLQPGARAVGSVALRGADDVADAPRRTSGGALVAGVKRSLAVDLGGIVLPTPVMIAAGCAGTGRELTGLVELRKVGAIVSRTITLEPEKGSPTPRIAESASGVVWSTGLQNPGIDAFVAEELPAPREVGHARRRLDRRRHPRGVRAAHRRVAGPPRGLRDRGAPVGTRSRAAAPDAGRPRRPGGRGRRRGRPHVDGARLREAPAARVATCPRSRGGGPGRGARG